MDKRYTPTPRLMPDGTPHPLYGKQSNVDHQRRAQQELVDRSKGGRSLGIPGRDRRRESAKTRRALGV